MGPALLELLAALAWLDLAGAELRLASDEIVGLLVLPGVKPPPSLPPAPPPPPQAVRMLNTHAAVKRGFRLIDLTLVIEKNLLLGAHIDELGLSGADHDCGYL